MELKLPGDRIINTEDDEQVTQLGRALVLAENAMSELKEELQKLHAAFAAAMARPAIAAAPDNSAIVSAFADMSRQLEKLGAPPVVNVPAQDNSGLEGAVRDLAVRLDEGVNRIVSAQLADTVLVRDELGEQTRSKKVPRAV